MCGAIEELLRILTRIYDYVIIDAGNTINACAIAALYAADTVFLVTNPDVPSIRNAQRLVERVRQLGAGSERVKVLLNRTSENLLITPKQIETALGYGDSPLFHERLPGGVHCAELRRAADAVEQLRDCRRVRQLHEAVARRHGRGKEPEKRRAFLGLL